DLIRRRLILTKMQEVFGLNIESNYRSKELAYTKNYTFNVEGVAVEQGSFIGFDSTHIEIYKLYPKGFSDEAKFKTIVLFSGHGTAADLVNKPSYQNMAGLLLAKRGFMVYVMENRGMGMLSHLGD